jgi:hypothetical protein
MVFAVITIAAILGEVYWLTYSRFNSRKAVPGKSQAGLSLATYFPWLGRSALHSFRPAELKHLQAKYRSWIGRDDEGWRRWIFVSLEASFVYLAISGFGFAIFSRRGMFGLFLLVHVVAGGIFAICLTVALIFKARDYRSFVKNKSSEKVHASLSRMFISAHNLKIIFFWAFVISGLLLIATALGSMLPIFSFDAQKVLLEVHRYSALVSLLSAIAFFTILPASQSEP